YINGGWTQTRFDQINLTVFESSAPSGAFVRRQLTMAGSSVAAPSLAGLFGLPPGFFLRSEYRYSTFSSKDLTFGGTGIGGETGVHMKKYVQTIGTALVWKFNWLGH